MKMFNVIDAVVTDLIYKPKHNRHMARTFVKLQRQLDKMTEQRKKGFRKGQDRQQLGI